RTAQAGIRARLSFCPWMNAKFSRLIAFQESHGAPKILTTEKALISHRSEVSRMGKIGRQHPVDAVQKAAVSVFPMVEWSQDELRRSRRSRARRSVAAASRRAAGSPHAGHQRPRTPAALAGRS